MGWVFLSPVSHRQSSGSTGCKGCNLDTDLNYFLHGSWSSKCSPSPARAIVHPPPGRWRRWSSAKWLRHPSHTVVHMVPGRQRSVARRLIKATGALRWFMVAFDWKNNLVAHHCQVTPGSVGELQPLAADCGRRWHLENLR